MGLQTYKKKRDFNRSPEPAGKVARSSTGRQFVVQKHDASQLHYDFRLELDGVLKSWAVPKGPCLDPSVKSLAIRVEDHPLDYADFEGVIPEGEYGGGTVMVWDAGIWEPEGDPQRDYKKGRLKFRLEGEKLNGSWALVQMHGDAGDGGKNWLLIKHDDEAARPRRKYDVLKKLPQSVATDRTMDEIAAAKDSVWSSNGKAASKKTADAKRAARSRSGTSSQDRAKGTPPVDPSKLPGARRARQPASFKPQLAVLGSTPPTGDEWVHEIKFDGYRMLAEFSRGKVRLVSRNGNDWSHRFPTVVAACEEMPVEQAILDGEIVSLDEQGLSDFQQLQNQLKRGEDRSLAFYLFDVPYLAGYDLTKAPLLERKELLEQLLARQSQDGVIRYSEHIAAEGADVLQEACKGGLEGIISKRIDGAYQQARSPAWRKSKCTKRQEFVIGGYTKPTGSRIGFGALLLGYYDDGELCYCGRVGTGFTNQSLRDLHRELKSLRTDSPAFKAPPTGADSRGVTWVKPKLVAEVEFTEWTDEGLLRHPSFQGLREDKPPQQIKREEPKLVGANGKGRGQKTLARQSSSVSANRDDTVAGVTLTHPDRILYPGQGITKRDLAEFYVSIADYVLPHVEGRPLTLVRCPRGQAKQCFYQKHLTGDMPPGLRGVMIQEKDDREEYVVVDDIAGVVSLVQMGALEMHPWPARADKLERPDLLVFDLDPSEEVAWKYVVQSARDVRDCLATLGLHSFVRTSGGKGLHVVAPLTRRKTWDELKSFAKGVAETIVRAAPDRYVATMSKAKRRGKIFVDYLRNQRGATAIASYSTRARPGAPVAVPLAWEELSTKTKPDMYTVQNLPKRFAALKQDPWEDFFTLRQSITAKMLRTLQA
jgi:bifunctional non-homologous end joining protein LigD